MVECTSATGVLDRLINAQHHVSKALYVSTNHTAHAVTPGKPAPGGGSCGNRDRGSMGAMVTMDHIGKVSEANQSVHQESLAVVFL